MAVKTYIRSEVFETNSSSSHSLTIDPSAVRDFSLMADALRAGVIEITLDSFYGWEWRRLHKPQSKLAYLLTQATYCGGGVSVERAEAGDDITEMLREGSSAAEAIIAAVEEATGCRVTVLAGSDAGIDHDSVGVGGDLWREPDNLLNFVFSKDAYVQTGNDNNKPPALIDTDLGTRSEMYPEHYREDEGEGLPIILEIGRERSKIGLTVAGKRTEVDTWIGGGGELCGDVKGLAISSAEITVFEHGSWRAGRFPSDRDEALTLLHGLINDLGGGTAATVRRDVPIGLTREKTSDVWRESLPYFRIEGLADAEAIEGIRKGMKAAKARQKAAEARRKARQASS